MSNSIYNDKKHAVPEESGKTEVVDDTFEPLLNIDEAKIKLQGWAKSFFDSGISTFINVSVGFGKSTIALQILKKIPSNKKVLFLVQRHELAEEIVQKYHKIRDESVDKSLTSFQRMMKPKEWRGIVHLKGKGLMCQNTTVLEKHKKEKISIPLSYCKDKCDKYALTGCKYIEQFNDCYTIRVMTHDEFRNENQSAWFYGSTGGDGSAPKYGKYKPDYIIVDEDWLKSDNQYASLNSKFDSIRNIVNEVMNGKELSEAIRNYEKNVFSDYERAQDIKQPEYKNTEQYITDRKKSDSQLRDYEILKAFYNYLNSDDDAELSRIKLYGKSLHYFRMMNIASRYENVPTLFLDATANKEILKEVVGDYDFHSIQVKIDDKVNVYQTTFNVSREWLLKDEDNLGHLVEYLKKLNAQYEKVGLITYKDISLNNGETLPLFDEYLKNETGIDVCDHFGNIRGIDVFEDVDCLVIAGFHFITLHEIPNYAHAIFGEQISDDWTWEDTPIRMKDGSVEYVSNRRYVDERLEWVKQHWCRAETIQAVGRARMIHTNKSKDIYVLSKESMGGDVEISGFIRKEAIVRNENYDEAIEKLKKIGYCRDKPSELRSLGLVESWVKNDPDGIDFAFVSAGIQRVTISFTDKHRNKKTPVYYVYDNDIFDMYLKEINATVVTCDTSA